MERLTERFDGWAMRKGCHGPCRTCDGAGCDDIYPMIDRLAAYEDTGLEPGEVMELAQAEKDGRAGGAAAQRPPDPGRAAGDGRGAGVGGEYKLS